MRCVVVLLLTGWSFAAWAEAPQVETSVRAPMEGFADERSRTVVDEDELREKLVTSVSQALEDEGGVTTQSTNRGAGTLILRGMVGPENLIVVDGVRFNQATFRTGPNQYLDTIDPWALERIEVLRGPAGVLYGTGAMGGVAVLQPHALPDAPQLRGQFLYRSADDTAAASADGGSGSDTLAARAGVTLRRHGRLRVGSNGSENRDFVSGVAGTEHLAIPYQDVHLRAATGVRLGRQRVRANYLGAVVRDAMRLDALGVGDVRVYDNDDHLAWITAEIDGPVGVDELHVNVSWHRTREEARRAFCAAPTGRVLDRFACARLDEDLLTAQRRYVDVVDTFGSSLTGSSRLLERALELKWGADAYFDGVESTRADARAPGFVYEERDRGNFADGSTYRTIGLFGLARYDLLRAGSRTLRAHGGARVEHFGAYAPDVAPAIGDIRYDHTGLVGSAGLGYLVGTTLNVYANWNQGFRAPNLQESTVLGDSGNFYEVPNPALGPERSDTFELGARMDWAQVLQLEAVVWASLLSDRIAREATTWEGQAQIDGKEVRQRVNRDRAYFYGADLGLRTRSWQGFSAFGMASLIDGAVEVDAEDPTFVEGPFHALLKRDANYENPRRLPPTSLQAGVRYAPSDADYHFTFFLAGAAAQNKLAPDDRSDLRICEVDVGVLATGDTCNGTPGWVTFNARAGYRLDRLRLDAVALNLTDARYRRHGSGVLAPGFDLGLQVTLDLP